MLAIAGRGQLRLRDEKLGLNSGQEKQHYCLKFRQGFSLLSFPALRWQGVLRFALLGQPSARCALPCVRCGVLHGALFGSLSVQHDVSCVQLGGQSAAIAAPPDDLLVLHGALPVLLASFYGACFLLDN
jgi:hypothetical protein